MSRPKPPGYLPAFCLSVLLPNVLLARPGALTVGGLGAEFGLTYLVWHDDPGKQFWVGFAFALVSLQALYIGFLLWGKKAGRPDQFARFPELADRVTPRLFLDYCLWVVGQLVLLVVVIGALVLLVQTDRCLHARDDRPGGGRHGRQPRRPPAPAELRPLAAARGGGGGPEPSSAAGGWPGTPSGSSPRPARRRPRASSSPG